MENTDKVQDKVVSMLDALQHGVTTVGNSVVKYTPDVVDAGLWVVRIDGIQTLTFSILGLLAAFILGHASYKFWKYLEKECELDGPVIVFPLFGGIITIIMIIGNTITLLNVWNWVAIFEPKLYLAKQIIDSVVK